MEKYDAIVVGAGISGLLSALALSKEGKNVLVLEKTGVAGGNCRTYEVENTGYFVDTGVHAITGLKNGPLVKLMDRYFSAVPSFIPHGPYYIREKNGLKKLPNMLQDIATLGFIPGNDRLILTKLILKAIAKHSAFKKEGTSVYDYVSEYTLSQETMKFLDTMSYFLSGVSMKETPVWRMISGGGLIDEGERSMHKKITDIARLAMNSSCSEQGYPRGGIGSITGCILHSLPKSAKINLSDEVQRIIQKKGGFEVLSSSGKYLSDIVVYSGDAKKLPEIAEMPDGWTGVVKKIKQSRAMTIWLGLKKPVKAIGYSGSEVWFLDGVSYWAMPTSNYDPHLAPKGKQLAGFSAFLSADENPIDYEKKLLETIYYSIPEIEKNIEMKHTQVLVPEKAAVSTGVIFPSPQTPVRNMYLVGTDADMRSMGVTRASYSVIEMLKLTGLWESTHIPQTRSQPGLPRPSGGIPRFPLRSMGRALKDLRR